MASGERLGKMQLRKSYANHWHTDLMSTITNDFPYFCFACWCGPCASYLLHKRALYNDMSRYVCCAGNVPCSGRCGESRCPECCLCTEVFLCFGNSVSSTRFLLQDEFNIQSSKCDHCIVEDASQILSGLADCAFCTVCACMQTQHKIEMDKRDGKFGPTPVMAVSPVQQMSRIDEPVTQVVYPP